MRRRDFIAGLGGAAVVGPREASGQQRPVPIIGWLGGSTPEAGRRNLDALLSGLRERGYEDGNSIRMIYRWAGGSASPLAELAHQLVMSNPVAIVAVTNPAAIACRQATLRIPVICPLLIDPVKTGLAETYNRPGRNVTGILQTIDTLPAKQVDLLLKVSPHTTVIAVLSNPDTLTGQILLAAVETAVRDLSLKMVAVSVRTPEQLPGAFDQMKRQGVSALVVLQDALFFAEDKRISALAEAARIATMHGFRQNVERGGLLSYGVDIPQNFHRAAYFLDRLLKGTPPGDLPIELPAKLELVINLKTAKTLGLSIPSSILFTADEVIE